ncbi:MAG: alginate lyase [Spirochaetaceae bacterium]|nr:MAG: alginate lyase [Spirochaetaceae bacterium]
MNADFQLAAIERPRILDKAARYLLQPPRTVTADRCARSQGGAHDYFSEGDYWWPDLENPGGPYIRRDGETNPDLFYAHRHSLVRLSEIVGTLVSAYLLTGDETYSAGAAAHLRAWFLDPETRMNPSLLYGQAIQGRAAGRSIGVIDTIHLAEVARGAKRLAGSASFSPAEHDGTRAWFREYLNWINTHEYGTTEREHPNNHGVCWSLQAAAFADLVGDDAQLRWVREQFKAVYVHGMMDPRGGFPAELARTKPYGYSLFVLDAMAGLAQIASVPEDDLWSFRLPDGRGMERAMAFLYPYIQDKSAWPFATDVMYWDEWPVRHPSLLFAGLAFGKREYLDTWTTLEPDPQTFETLRNLPLRHPLLWVETNGTSTTA